MEAKGIGFSKISRTLPLIVRGESSPLKPGTVKFTQSVRAPSVTATGKAVAGVVAPTGVEHPSIPPVRAGLASGEVTLRDGDVFGPVVNLAARAVKVAGPGEVITSSAVAAAAGLPAEPLGERVLKGFDVAVDLCRLRAQPSGDGR